MQILFIKREVDPLPLDPLEFVIRVSNPKELNHFIFFFSFYFIDNNKKNTNKRIEYIIK
jgi:hypothetical protein